MYAFILFSRSIVFVSHTQVTRCNLTIEITINAITDDNDRFFWYMAILYAATKSKKKCLSSVLAWPPKGHLRGILDTHDLIAKLDRTHEEVLSLEVAELESGQEA